MFIKSDIFEDGEKISKEYSCEGLGLRPNLQIGDIPIATKSLAITMRDPDAIMEGGFIHWMVWNIDPKIEFIKSDDILDKCIQGLNSAGKIGYIAPCPRNGAHHYIFSVFALDSILDLQKGVSFEKLNEEIKKSLLAQTQIIGIYEKSNK